jgi:hypothetical protein
VNQLTTRCSSPYSARSGRTARHYARTTFRVFKRGTSTHADRAISSGYAGSGRGDDPAEFQKNDREEQLRGTLRNRSNLGKNVPTGKSTCPADEKSWNMNRDSHVQNVMMKAQSGRRPIIDAISIELSGNLALQGAPLYLTPSR